MFLLCHSSMYKFHVYREIENHHYIPESRVVSGAEKECGYDKTIDRT